MKHAASTGQRRGHGPAGEASKPTAWGVAKTVAWGFFGVRKRGDHDDVVTKVNPVHVVVAGFVGVLVLVAGLIVLVNWVVAT